MLYLTLTPGRGVENWNELEVVKWSSREEKMRLLLYSQPKADPPTRGVCMAIVAVRACVV